jgi:hypothetical protein
MNRHTELYVNYGGERFYQYHDIIHYNENSDCIWVREGKNGFALSTAVIKDYGLKVLNERRD